MIGRITLQSLKMLMVLTLVAGAAYPAAVGAAAWILFAHQAGGSLVYTGEKIAGSELLGQKFTKSIYFMPRPSATEYGTVPSGATNYGPQDVRLKDAVTARRNELAQKFGSDAEILKSGAAREMLFASASGLDPHISPEAAMMQADSVARARGFDGARLEIIKKTIENLTQRPQFEFMGQPRINVLKLNMEIDKL